MSRRSILLLTTMAAALLVASGVALAATISCPNRDGNLCVGTAQADTMTGRDYFRDDMRGMGGADTLRARGNDDKLTGGFGNDTLKGARGSDTYLFDDGWGKDIIGGEDGGVDTLDFSAVGGGKIIVSLLSSQLGAEASMGTSTLNFPSTVVIENVSGGSLDDHISGNAANNSLYGDAGLDTIDGGPGNDLINGVDGPDSLYGGDNHDTMYGFVGGDALEGEGGPDEMFGAAGDDTLKGGDGNDTMSGYWDPCDVRLWEGETDTDMLEGGAGNDWMIGGPGLTDELVGGPGNDRIYGDHDIDLLSADGDVCSDGYGGGDSTEPWSVQGDDHIYARDGEEDRIFCAGGTDTVEADPIDVLVDETCETVNTNT